MVASPPTWTRRTTSRYFPNDFFMPSRPLILHSVSSLQHSHASFAPKRVSRPIEVPDTGLLCDTLWSDPDRDISGWAENDRGVSYTFGTDVIQRFLERNDFDLIVRAHQVRASARAMDPRSADRLPSGRRTARACTRPHAHAAHISRAHLPRTSRMRRWSRTGMSSPASARW